MGVMPLNYAYAANPEVLHVGPSIMAERSSWLGRMFETDDAQLKNEIRRGADAPMSQEEFRVFRESGKPSVAVVLSIIKHKE